MASLHEQLARLRRHNRSVREGDNLIREEAFDLGAFDDVVPEGIDLAAVEALIEEESIIMRRERPVLAIKHNVAELKFIDQAESEVWRERLKNAAPMLANAIPAVGRINLQGGSAAWVGTGWLVAEDTIVTNRHVAQLFSERRSEGFTFKMGVSRRVSADVDFLQEIDNFEQLVFKLKRPLHIEAPSGPDVAFLEIEMVSGNARLARPIELASRITATENAATIGYPAFDSRIPEPELMERIYGKVYNKKRLAPGGITGVEGARVLHNCTTLGGNSGSALIDLDSGAALGLHFSGSFMRTNYAVRADVVKQLLDGVRAGRPARRSAGPQPGTFAAPISRKAEAGVGLGVRAAAGGSTISIPLTLNVTVSLDVAGGAGIAGPSAKAPPSEGDDIDDIDDGVEGEEAVPADYDDRTGYEGEFLGKKHAVPLPEVTRNVRDVLGFKANGKDETVLRYQHFSVVMSRSRRMCFFSACNIDGDTSKKTSRGPWRWDPRIPKELQIMKECYGNPPKFSRGHMTRREDPGWGSKSDSQRGADDSMHVTNAVPQMQAFNSPIWLALEDYALQHARRDDMRISVFTGPYFAKSDPKLYGVKIPKAFWKVIAFIHDETGELCATGYEMSQKDSLPTEEEFVFGAFKSPQLGIATQVAISSIERKSGISFGPLAQIDALGEDQEGTADEAARGPLLALEQIRFVGEAARSQAGGRASRVSEERAAQRTPSTAAAVEGRASGVVAEGGGKETPARLPPAAALSQEPDTREFSLNALKVDGFSWQKALSLALASRLAYETSDATEQQELVEWGFERFTSMSAGGMVGFAAFANDVLLVSFRGTDNLTDWLYNLDIGQEKRPYGGVHRGFFAGFQRLEPKLRGLLANAGNRKVWLTGHSLGGAIASIAAAEIDIPTLAGVYTFGQPRSFEAAAAAVFDNRLAGRHVRFVNNRDLVTRIPPGFAHVGRLVHFNADGRLDESGMEGAGSGEAPAYTIEKFDRLKNEIGRMRMAEAVSTRRGKEPVTSTSVEGIFPGVAQHHIGRYIAIISNFTTHTETDPTIEVEFASRTAAEGLESAGGATPGRRATDNIPLLLQVRSKDWSPPSGVEITSKLGHIWSAQARNELVQKLQSDPGLVSIELSREGGTVELTRSVPYVRGDLVHRPPVGERGDAALVGIIDTGVDILHHAFRADDGSPSISRIIAIWNQKDDTGPSPHAVDPGNFSQKYGTLFCSKDIQQLIDAGSRIPSALRDPQGHGTHVASIASGRRCGHRAGSADPRMADGMAPDAGIVVVIPKLSAKAGDPWSLGYSNSHADAIAFLQSVAQGRNRVLATGLPMAVNMSIGMNAGGHDGSSLLEAGIDSCTNRGQMPGFVIVKSAGNERGYGGHQRVAATVGVVTIEWDSSDTSRRRDYFEVWYSHFDDLSFTLKDPAGNVSPVVSSRDRRKAASLGGNACSLSLALLQGDRGDNRLTITISEDAGAIQPGRWILTVEGHRLRSQDRWVDIWVERDDTARAVRFQPETPNVTLSIPGTAETVICVAACESQDPLSVIKESSYGPTRTGGPKPDIAAPGHRIAAALSNTPDHDAVVPMTGTSMAAPHVTGALALALSARHKQGNRPQHNAVQLRNALTSQANHFGQHHAGSGYGLLDAEKLLQFLNTIG